MLCLTSPDLVFRAAAGAAGADARPTTRSWTTLFPAERTAPIVTVLDGHPHTLSFLAAVARSRRPRTSASTTSVSPATSHDLYRAFGIDVDTIVGAAIDLLT